MALKHKEGFPFSFNARACDSCGGKCCTGQSGYIWATPEEIESMAESLGLTFAQFATRYTHRVNGRFTLNEVQRPQGDFACVFFDQGCKIYDQRPEQCRTFPFWEHFKREPRVVISSCPGTEALPSRRTSSI